MNCMTAHELFPIFTKYWMNYAKETMCAFEALRMHRWATLCITKVISTKLTLSSVNLLSATLYAKTRQEWLTTYAT